MRWHSTFGEIAVQEQTYYQPKGGSLLRPFLLSSGVNPRGYSKPLQRRITDFGADVPFAKVNEKLREHYGITVPSSSVRSITLHHAHALKQLQDEQLGKIDAPEKGCIISETDGSMIPIVKTRLAVDDEVLDRRKDKELFYREVKLSLAHDKNSVTPLFSATMGNAELAGKHMLHCVKLVGVGKHTKVHGVGDGAPWIANRMEEQFGSNATYLIDFYHLCEYLSAATPVCAPKNEKAWLDQQKALLKQSCSSQVLLALQAHVESQDISDEEAPVRACYRYIKNRPHQLDYKTAIEEGLPIGSGEIESAHRYVIQKRLKIAGAWWREENAADMLALRVNRANGQWNDYWEERKAA